MADLTPPFQKLILSPVCPPLVLSTSSVPIEPDLHGQYARIQDLSFDNLKHQLNNIYGSKKTVLLPSGLAAISVMMQTCLETHKDVANPIMIVSHEMYRECYRLLDHLPLDYHVVKMHRLEKVKEMLEKFSSQIICIYTESCSNPSGLVPAFKELRTLINKYPEQAWLVVDNSWLTGLIYNPLMNDIADAVLESGSKHVGGGRVIFGFLSGNNQVIDDIEHHSIVHGQRMSQFDAWLASDSLQTLDMRIQRCSQIAIEVARWLESQPKCRVLYPLLESHPTHATASSLFQSGLGPAQMWFYAPMEEKKARKVLLDLAPHILHATSYGKAHTLIDTYPRQGTEFDFDDEDDIIERDLQGVWLRLSIGYASRADLVVQALDTFLSNL